MSEQLPDEELLNSLDTLEPKDEKEPENLPKFGDKNWHDFVMKEFSSYELVSEPKIPTVDGLRRVVEKLVGSVVESYPEVIQAPRLTNKTGINKKTLEKVVFLELAVVKWTVVIDCFDGNIRKFSDVGTVYLNNTDWDFARHPTETAATKAESRALRKALRLRTISAEEKVNNTVEVDEVFEDNEGELLKPSTKALLNVLANRKKTSLTELFEKEVKSNSQYSDLESIDEISDELGRVIIKKLQER